MKNSPFSPRAVVLLIACAAALFAASALLSVYGGGPVSEGERFAPGAYSVSAIGHAGFYDLLRRMDYNVVRSAGNTLAAVGTRGVLIAAEPDVKYLAGAEARLKKLLLVLPKWRGTQDERHRSWISGAKPVALGAAQQVLTLSGCVRSSVFRRELTDEEKTAWAVNELGIEPALSGAAQLIRSDEMRPIVGGGDGILLGEITKSGRKIFVLSDPDVMSNHGIVKGDNAAFMLAAIDALMVQDGLPVSGLPMTGLPVSGLPVVFDETIHGFRTSQGSPLELPFRFPFVVVTALTCAAALIGLSGTRRFGVPVTVKPGLGFGKAALITNSAKMLDYAGHHAPVLERYIKMTLRSAAAALHAPSFDDSEAGIAALCAWLDQAGKAGRAGSSCADIIIAAAAAVKAGEGEKISLPRLFDSAQKIYDWKQEILKEENK